MFHTSIALILAAVAISVSPAGETCTTSKPTVSAILPVGGDIVETAVAAGSFKTLAAALEAAGLVETLKGKGPFTVFAPTDAAFAALPKGTLESLLDPKNKATLQAILTYHVVPGSITAGDVMKLKSAVTVNGHALKAGDALKAGEVDAISISNGSGAEVLLFDLGA